MVHTWCVSMEDAAWTTATMQCVEACCRTSCTNERLKLLSPALPGIVELDAKHVAQHVGWVVEQARATLQDPQPHGDVLDSLGWAGLLLEELRRAHNL